MQPEELKKTFDQQASSYDQQSAKTAPIVDALHFLLEAVFSSLPQDAHILCVGVGTGVELVYLAQRFPTWRFTAVEPAGAMLDICRGKAETIGFVDRCQFHEGYVESLPTAAVYDATTAFLVSQFILDRGVRTAFFQSIAQRLKPGAILASADLAADVDSSAYSELLKDWVYVRTAAVATPEQLAQMRATYTNHVAILPPMTVAAIIEAGGFATPVPFFQASLIHAWHAKRV